MEGQEAGADRQAMHLMNTTALPYYRSFQAEKEQVLAQAEVSDSDDEEARRNNDHVREALERERQERMGELNRWKVRATLSNSQFCVQFCTVVYYCVRLCTFVYCCVQFCYCVRVCTVVYSCVLLCTVLCTLVFCTYRVTAL